VRLQEDKLPESYQGSKPSSTADALATRVHGDLAVNHESARGLRESVSHRLRTPLTVVLGHAELLSNQQQELAPEVRESLECLLRAAQRLKDVVVEVCDLMDTSCLCARTVESADIPELVAEEVATYRDGVAL
jgi:K+-sensing histidine kinase KdpD